jgi:hypothetical protein
MHIHFTVSLDSIQSQTEKLLLGRLRSGRIAVQGQSRQKFVRLHPNQLKIWLWWCAPVILATLSHFHQPFVGCFFPLFFPPSLWYWDLNSGPHAARQALLLLEPLYQPMLGIFKIGSLKLFASADLNHNLLDLCLPSS